MKSLLAIQDGRVVMISHDTPQNRIEAASSGYDVVTVSVRFASENYGKPCPDFEALIRSHRRYETLRTLNPREFAELTAKNIESGVAFDDLVDELTRGDL
jgi:hypothetical protein